MAGATGYNLAHAQVAAKAASPVWKDINYARSADFPITQDSNVYRADAAAVITAFGAPTGDGSITFGSADLAMMAILTGGVVSSSGAGAAAIDRLEIKGNGTPPPIMLALWIPNVDGNSTKAGIRVTVLNGRTTVPNASYDQESWTEFSSDVAFNPNENNDLLIYETLGTAPTFTAGVMPVNITAPV